MDIMTETKDIDGVAYTFRQANFNAARGAATKVISLLKGAIKANGSGEVDIDLSSILENIGSPAFQDVEKFILSYLEIKTTDDRNINGGNNSAVETHFNQHRQHYYQVIVSGAIFHFKDFLPNMGELLKGINLSGTDQATAIAAQA